MGSLYKFIAGYGGCLKQDSRQPRREDSRHERDFSRSKNLYTHNEMATSQATTPSGVPRDPHAGIGHSILDLFRR
jgi:hypothetical protein